MTLKLAAQSIGKRVLVRIDNKTTVTGTIAGTHNTLSVWTVGIVVDNTHETIFVEPRACYLERRYSKHGLTFVETITNWSLTIGTDTFVVEKSGDCWTDKQLVSKHLFTTEVRKSAFIYNVIDAFYYNN